MCYLPWALERQYFTKDCDQALQPHWVLQKPIERMTMTEACFRWRVFVPMLEKSPSCLLEVERCQVGLHERLLLCEAPW